MFVLLAEQIARNDITAQDGSGQQQHICTDIDEGRQYGQDPAENGAPDQRRETQQAAGQKTPDGIDEDKNGITMLPVAATHKDEDDQSLDDPNRGPDIPQAIVDISLH